MAMQNLITGPVPWINDSVTFGPKWDSCITHSEAQNVIQEGEERICKSLDKSDVKQKTVVTWTCLPVALRCNYLNKTSSKSGSSLLDHEWERVVTGESVIFFSGVAMDMLRLLH